MNVKGKVVLALAGADSRVLAARMCKGDMWFYAGNDVSNYARHKKELAGVCIPAGTPEEFHNFVAGRKPDFVKWMDERCAAVESHHFFWADNSCSKDPGINDLFEQTCYLLWIMELFKKNGRSLLVVAESLPLLFAVKANLEKAGVEVAPAVLPGLGIFYARQLLRGAGGFLYKSALFLYRMFLAQVVFRRRLADGTQRRPFVLVDTFVWPNDFDEDGNFVSRYYPGFFEYLDRRERRYLIYPKFYGIGFGNAHSIIARSRKCASHGFLLPEDVVTVTDFFYAFFFPMRKLFYKGGVSEACGVDVRYLLKKEWWRHLLSSGTLHSVLYYRVPARLRDRGITPTHFIIWFENQSADKARVAGFHRFLPESCVIGIQGYVPPNNQVDYFATDMEARLGTVPDRLLVPGKDLIKPLAEFISSVPVIDAASLRYGYLYGLVDELDSRVRESGGGRVRKSCLVIFPQTIPGSVTLLAESALAMEKLIAAGFEVLYKTHPSIPVEKFLVAARRAGLNPDKERFVAAPLRDLFFKTGLVLSYESGAAVEAVCCGIKVLVLAPSAGIELTPVFPESAKGLWKKVYGRDDMEKAVFEWASEIRDGLENRETLDRNILEHAFNPLTDQYFEPFIGVSQPSETTGGQTKLASLGAM